MKQLLLTLLMISACLLGFTVFGVIVTEVLKKWQLVSKDLSPVWAIGPLLLLFMTKKATNSPYFRTHSKLSPVVLNTSERPVEIILIVLAILAIISLPFLWFGVIEEAAREANVGKF